MTSLLVSVPASLLCSATVARAEPVSMARPSPDIHTRLDQIAEPARDLEFCLLDFDTFISLKLPRNAHLGTQAAVANRATWSAKIDTKVGLDSARS
jgi:hypothetical protein